MAKTKTAVDVMARLAKLVVNGFMVTAGLIMNLLSKGLYSDNGRMLMELVRNSVVAASLRGWKPSAAHVELWLERGHPLNPMGKVLTVFDKGSGITEIGWARYMRLGQDIAEMLGGKNGSHGGAAQMCIGRLAAGALNAAMVGGDASQGWTVITRSETTGILKLTLTPKLIEQKALQLEETTDQDPLLGRYVGKLPETFTLILIPNPVFETDAEMSAAINGYLPRGKDKMFPLWIGGKMEPPPPLASTRIDMALADKRPEALVTGYALARVEEGESGFKDSKKKVNSEGGVWLTDADTGIRITKFSALGTFSPEFLNSHSLEGDVFVRRVLENQNTARDGLRNGYAKTNEWKVAVRECAAYVCPVARDLLGHDEIFSDSDQTSLIRDVADVFAQVYGEPAGAHTGKGPGISHGNVGGGGGGGGGGGSGGTGTGGGGGNGGGGNNSGGDSDGNPETGTPRKDRTTIPIKCDDKEYFLVPSVMHFASTPYRLASFDQNSVDRDRIFINRDRDSLSVDGITNQRELMLNAVLLEIGHALYDEDVDKVLDFCFKQRVMMFPGGQGYKKPKKPPMKQ